MRPVPPSIATGSSLAIALKALSWLDRPASDPIALCSALGLASQTFDWFAFTVGLLVGITVVVTVEFLLTLRLAIRTWVASCGVVAAPQQRPAKPLYKIL